MERAAAEVLQEW